MLRKLTNTTLWRIGVCLLVCSVVESACEMPLTAPTPTLNSPPVQPVVPNSTPAGVQETEQVFLPDIDKPEPENTPAGNQATPNPAQSVETPTLDKGSRLAYLKNGDLWLVELPSVETRRLTSSSDLLTFAWSPDGARLATFNGRSICFVEPSEVQASECLGLGLTDEQAIIPRGIVWSPDKQSIVLWNLANPWDDQAVGWLVTRLSPSQEVLRISDPVEFGYNQDGEALPGGFTGQPAFLPDGTLIGTLSHRSQCGSGGCSYQLYTFDIGERKFAPFANKPEEGWSEGQNLAISPNGQLLANFGTFFSECDAYVTFADTFEIDSGERNAYNLELEALTSFDFSPDGRQAIIARVSGCASPPEQTTWDRACGLSQGFDTYPLQIWNLESGERADIYPGLSPDWSPNRDLIAFRSCLAESASGAYETDPTGPPTIYVLDLESGDLLQIGEGLTPAWSP